MQLPDSVRAIAVLAPNKRVTVIHAGKVYALPFAPEPAPVVSPHPMEVVSKQMQERDAEIRDLLLKVSSRTDDAMKEVKEAVVSVASGQTEVVQSIKENTRTLHLPVKPVYDKDGKVIAAQRVKNERT